MRIQFDGKTVVVSGVGHGFGRCIAETFAQLGARVFGCDLSAAELAETATAGVEAEVVDLSDRVACQPAAEQDQRKSANAKGPRRETHLSRHRPLPLEPVEPWRLCAFVRSYASLSTLQNVKARRSAMPMRADDVDSRHPQASRFSTAAA